MAGYVMRRLLLAVPTVLGVATFSFLLLRMIPGDPARVIAGTDASAEQVALLRHQLGLDKPLIEQYLSFIGGLLTGDLGTSVRGGQPVLDQISSAAPYTIQLAVITIIVAVPIGCTLGVIAAVHRGRLTDIVVSLLSVVGVSMPVYWTGLLLVVIFAVNLRMLPAAGANQSWSWVLPVVTLSLFAVGFIARQTRSAMLDVLRQDFVRTARAKGASRQRVIWRHAFRNALVPIVTIVGIQFGTMLSGAILTETVFAWPGLGRLLVEAIFQRDFPVVQATVFVLAVALVLINLIVDLIYAYVDPRIRYD